MRKRSTLVVLAALLSIFGYFTWEYYSEKKYEEKERRHEQKGEDEEEGKDRIDLAVLQEIKRTKDPNTNSVPIQRLIQAKAFKEQKLTRLNNNRTTTAVPSINWVERGPSNVGGRSRVIWYDLSDAGNGYKKVWAGSVAGGLWYTNDITVASPVWNKINDFFDNIAVTSFAQSTSSPNIMYFGTGEGWFNLDAIEGLGIWKSTDGGENWSQLSSTLNFAYVQDLLIDQNGNLYATVRNRTGSQARGIQKSTDGGNTWTQVLGAPLVGFVSGRGSDLELAANGDIYASIGHGQFPGQSIEGRIYRSSFATNGVNTGDAGTWSDITPNPTTNTIPAAGDNYDRIEITTAPGNGDVVYGIFEGDGTSNVSNIKQYDGSTNTWTSRTVPNYSGGGPYTRDQAWYDLIATVDPNNANTLYIGAIDVYKSTNNGANWTRVSDWRSIGLPYVHADIHQISYAPGSSNRLAIGCDGGVFYSTDANLTTPGFAEKNSGYNVTQFYSVAIHPSSTNFFLAGAQDNGSQRFTTMGMNSTTEVTGGDGAFCHIDQDNPNIQITSYVFNNYYITTNGWASYGSLYSDPDPNGSGDFINPTDYDNTANVLYACSSEDIDGGPSINYVYNRYTRITGVGTTNTASLVTLSNSPTTALITHVAVSPSVSNRVYFGFDNGTLGYVTNANTGTSNTINLLTATGVAGSVSCISVDPANENHILITYSNYGVNSIWETTNGGTSWTSVEGNLPDMPVRWAMFDPRNSDWALIATELGVWSTDNINGGSTDWGPTNSGLANVRVDMLQYRSSDRTIAAATHGRGLFTAVVPISTTPDISFVSLSGAATELTTSTSACRPFTDYSINMHIANAPTGDATVTVAVAVAIPEPGTAIQGIDYDFTTNGNFAAPDNKFIFTSGSTEVKTINLRIYDDAEVEAVQTFTLTYSFSGTTNAQAGSTNQTYTFTINDNDNVPTAASSANYTVATFDVNSTFSSPFQSENKKAKSQFLITASELNAAGLVGGRQITALAWNVITKATINSFNGFTISMGHTTATNLNAGFISPTFAQVFSGAHSTTTGWQTITFTTPFTWDGTSNLLVQTCFDNGGAGATPGIDVVQGTLAPFGSSTAATALTATNAGGTAGCSISNASNLSASRPQFRFTQAVPQTPIESALNATRSFYLGPNADVYLYSAADGELIGRIQNQSSHDYGCTSIEIDRAGTGGSQFWNTNTANYLMNKTFRIVPTNNNPAGQYTITLYLTSTEVNGWQTATGQQWANIQLIKLPGQISNVTPTTPEPDGVGTVQVVTPTLGTLGTNYTMSYPFSNGFSGFGAGIPGAQGTLPIKLLSFTGKLQSENVKLNWSTAFEQNSKGFEIEKSLDGVNFKKIGFVAGAGSSNATRIYSFTHPQRAVEFNYYRLKLVDIDNTFDFTDVVLVKNSFGKQDAYLAGNPITNNINIQFAKTPNGKVSVSIYDMKGSKIYQATYNNYTQTSLQINTANKLLAHGVYSVKVETGGKIYNLKAIK